ncbi:MAG TPA: AAA family ATPase [Candidatus Dormibacteraeota bacterium]|nr:AAA family ATPase [Candidatus Dormibacteraeota bacterium]
MATQLLSVEQARELEVRAAKVFQPRTPIAAREFFAGRWNQITTLADAVGQPGLHVVIYGERGVGKTSLANVVKTLIRVFDEDQEEQKRRPERCVIKTNASSGDTFSSIWLKLFGEILWTDDRPSIGLVANGKKSVQLTEALDLPNTLSVDLVRRVISRIPGSVFIIDEFDRAAKAASREFTDLIKALSDFALDCTVVLVGVSSTVDELVSDHASITRTLVQILLPRMEAGELKQILSKAEETLSVVFDDDAANLIVRISQGLPHYTHLLGLHTVRIAAKGLSSRIQRSAVFGALKESVTQAQQSVTEKHLKATHSAHKDALYRQVLLACALTAARNHDALGYFTPGAVVDPLSNVLGRSAEISTFSNHLSEFCKADRGGVLERTGQARAYRFRFSDPLLVPFIFMDAVNTGLIDDQKLAGLLDGELS